MKEWIEKNLDPPGMERKNQRSIFSFIGRVFGIVKDDAVKAHNAFFPYLCDSDKLRQHGKSLMIPELPFDSEKNYRDRVATASFYLMRAGERSYIHEQLQAHFGDAYLLTEEFLQVFIKIPDLSNEERAWVYSFLDGILDPNISLTVAEWLHYIDTLLIDEDLIMRAKIKHVDSFNNDEFLCNGRFYCDQGKEILCDGTWLCDGSVKCNYYFAVIGTISDYILEEVYANGFICNGEFDCSGYNEIYSPIAVTEPILLRDSINEEFKVSLYMEPFEDQMQMDAICDGAFLCDGSNMDSIADGPMNLRVIMPLICDGSKMPFAEVCDGSWVCDGTYSDSDGLHYSGGVILLEEVL
jgi:hypothetical protein